MNKVRVLSALVALILVLSAIGCGGAATGRAALYGTWEMDQDGVKLTWIFNQDGTTKFGADPLMFDMKYEFVDDSTIKITDDMGLGMAGIPITFKVDGNKLTLTVEGESLTLTRK